MKYLKRFNQIQEAVGVPTGITELSSKLFYSILEKLDSGEASFDIRNGSRDKYIFKTREIDIYFSIPLEGKINDYEVSEFNVLITIHVVKRPEYEAPEMTGAYFSPDIDIDRKNFKMKYTNTDTIDLGIRLEFPWHASTDEEFWIEEVSDMIRENKSDVISSLGHELMHSYDLAFIKGGTKFEDTADYQTVSNLRFDIPVVDSFFYYLYFMSRCESTVRSAEIASRMEAQGTTQEQFLDFIKNNKVWTKLKEISKWTYAGFRQSIIDDADAIKENLEEKGVDTNGLSAEQVADLVESLILNNIFGAKSETVAELMKDPKYLACDDDFMRMLASLSGETIEEDPDKEEKSRFLESFMEKMRKEMKNSKHYFESKEKMFNFESNKLLKKISKLFSMATDTKKNAMHSKISDKKYGKNESILNWEKYQYALGVKPKISNKKFI